MSHFTIWRIAVTIAGGIITLSIVVLGILTLTQPSFEPSLYAGWIYGGLVAFLVFGLGSFILVPSIREGVKKG